jgi:hypothetical protein
MQLRTRMAAWAAFLLSAGLFLLLKNQGVFGAWGEVAWGGLFAATGLGFLVWFVLGLQQWWRAVPGFTLLSAGALALLSWRGIDLGDWRGALTLLGVALGFWAALLVSAANWWAIIPAGALTLLAALTGLQARLSEAFWLAIWFFGLGVVFLLVYLLRLRQHDARWATIPTAALLLLGLVTLVNAATLPLVLAQWWPALLLAGGLGLLILAIGRPQASPPVTPLPPAEATSPAAGSSITEALPAASALPPAPAAVPAAPQPAAAPDAPAQVDIYEFLKQQPGESKQDAK